MSHELRVGFAITVLLIAAAALFGQFTGIEAIKTWGGKVGMALPTATCLCLLACIELFRKEGGPK